MSDETSTKVLLVTFDVVPDPTGTSAHLTELIRGLTPFHEVDVLSAKTPDHAHIERYHGARLLRVPVGTGDVRSRAESFTRAVRRQLQSEEYDLVHFTDPFGGYPICELRPGLGYKLVYEARGFPSVELKYTDPVVEGDRPFLTKVRRQEIFCLTNSDVVFTTCDVATEHIASLGVNRAKLRVLPPLVDPTALADVPPPDGDPLRLVYLGNHASWQGLPSLLFALRTAVKKAPMKCRIIGPSHGSWQRQLQEMIREFELRESVTMEIAVPHEDIPTILAESDVGVAPLQKGDRNQTQGASPMKIAEYLTAGRPVVCGDLPITRALVTHEETGLLYPPSDEDALSAALVRLATEPELRMRLGTRAAEVARERYDAARGRALVLRTYSELVSPSVLVSEEAFTAAPASEDASNPEEPTLTLPADKLRGEEGPTSSANLEEIVAKLELDTPEPDTATGAKAPGDSDDVEPPVPDDSEDTGGALEAEQPTGPRPVPEGFRHSSEAPTGQRRVDVPPEEDEGPTGPGAVIPDSSFPDEDADEDAAAAVAIPAPEQDEDTGPGGEEDAEAAVIDPAAEPETPDPLAGAQSPSDVDDDADAGAPPPEAEAGAEGEGVDRADSAVESPDDPDDGSAASRPDGAVAGDRAPDRRTEDLPIAFADAAAPTGEVPLGATGAEDAAEAGGAEDAAEAGGAEDAAEAGGAEDAAEAESAGDAAQAGGAEDAAGAAGADDDAGPPGPPPSTRRTSRAKRRRPERPRGPPPVLTPSLAMSGEAVITDEHPATNDAEEDELEVVDSDAAILLDDEDPESEAGVSESRSRRRSEDEEDGVESDA